MNVIEQTEEFAGWLDGLKDRAGQLAILKRIDRAELGSFGDCDAVGEGVSEMRIFAGPGYRVYFARKGVVV